MKKIFGVIGDPVLQSLSPQMHNAAHQALGIAADYQHFHVLKNDLERFFDRLHSGEISGVNVTSPHKKAVVKLCDELTPEAEAIGAVNTIFSQNGKLIGDNTDGRGYRKALLHEFELNIGELNVVVIGAGGASQAICHSLCAYGVPAITVANRTRERAANMVARLQTNFVSAYLQTATLAQLPLICDEADLIINTTTLGMQKSTWDDLNFISIIPAHAIVSDIVCDLNGTELLNTAIARGLKTIDGYGMLVEQAALSFELFTGTKAPTHVMRKALKS